MSSSDEDDEAAKFVQQTINNLNQNGFLKKEKDTLF